MKNLDTVLSLVDFLNQFREVDRKIYVRNSEQMENDVEHSYQLSMLCWFLINHFKLDLDITLIFKYALAHDLVEIYAGDTAFLDKLAGADKKERETVALEKIEAKFGNVFPDMIETIKEYERSRKKGGEASFVYSLDKLIPLLNIYQDGGRSWRDLYPDLKLEMAIDLKREKIKTSPHIEKIFDELIVLLREQKGTLFANPD